MPAHSEDRPPGTIGSPSSFRSGGPIFGDNALMSNRTLSKSDFKIARTCVAKLFFRENHYPDNLGSNQYLALLADGGYMVEALEVIS